MKQFISRSLFSVWIITTLSGLLFSRADAQLWLLVSLSGFLCSALAWLYVADWRFPKLLQLLIGLEGFELAGLFVAWTNHFGPVPHQIWFLVADLVGMTLACIMRLLSGEQSSDWMLVIVCGCVAFVLAVTCLLYPTLDEFVAQSTTRWSFYLLLVAPFGYTALTGLVLYLVHSLRLVVDELVFHESF